MRCLIRLVVWQDWSPGQPEQPVTGHDGDHELGLLGLGPMSVLPPRQREGIGTRAPPNKQLPLADTPKSRAFRAPHLRCFAAESHIR